MNAYSRNTSDRCTSMERGHGALPQAESKEHASSTLGRSMPKCCGRRSQSKP